MSVSSTAAPIVTTPPRHTARKTWSYEENAALQAAVQQHLAAHKFLDWNVIAAAFPGRTAHGANNHYNVLLTRLTRPAVKADYSKPCAVAAPTVCRPCLRCRMRFNSEDRKRNWICNSCKRSLSENPFTEVRVLRQAA